MLEEITWKDIALLMEIYISITDNDDAEHIRKIAIALHRIKEKECEHLCRTEFSCYHCGKWLCEETDSCCEYSKSRDECDFCGEPEERK